jgi:hypothetical protein
LQSGPGQVLEKNRLGVQLTGLMFSEEKSRFMNLPIKIPEDKRAKFLEIVTTFQNDLRNIDELSYAWLEGFCNYLLHSHTDHDDDNNYDPREEPNYTSYKEGAKAGMQFIKRSQKDKE